MALTASTKPINFSVRRYMGSIVLRTDFTATIFLEYTKLINILFLSDVQDHIISNFDFKTIHSPSDRNFITGETYEMTLYGKGKTCAPSEENIAQEILLSIYANFKDRQSLMGVGSVLLVDNGSGRSVEVRLKDIPLSDRRTFFSANGSSLTS